MKSSATTVAEYLESLEHERRKVITAVRDVVNRNVDPGMVETMQWGMIAWVIPMEVSGPTYNGQPLSPFALAAQKNNYSLYMMSLYAASAGADGSKWFVDAWKKTGKKLDIGKACIRFKKTDDLALELIGEAVKRVTVDKFLAVVRAVHGKKAANKTKSQKARKAKPAKS